MRGLLWFSGWVDRLSVGIGQLVRWLVLASVLISAGNAVMRKAFNIGSNAFLEIQWYLFGRCIPARRGLHLPAERPCAHRRRRLQAVDAHAHVHRHRRVNSIRLRLEQMIDWQTRTGTDVLCVQETKVMDADFPIQAIEDAGFHVAFFGQKSYNGVAIISKFEIADVQKGFADDDDEAETANRCEDKQHSDR